MRTAMKIKRILLLLVLSLNFNSCSNQPKGKGLSISQGSVSKGSLENGRRFPYRGSNFKYFSFLSYTFFNRAWVHSKVLDISLEAYEEMEHTYPEKNFLLMECSQEKGGRMWPHRTHQNGTSIDFGVPLVKKGKARHLHNYFGIYHYLMAFDEEGKTGLAKNISIDFEAMAQHILALEKAARKRGMFIKKVILKIDLKDDFYNTPSGKIVKRKGIYFAKALPKTIDDLHDDHYHIDFGF
jgi:penicillin-insensitive murein endopeptidase